MIRTAIRPIWRRALVCLVVWALYLVAYFLGVWKVLEDLTQRAVASGTNPVVRFIPTQFPSMYDCLAIFAMILWSSCSLNALFFRKWWGLLYGPCTFFFLPALYRRPYLEAVIDSSLWAAIIAPFVLPPLLMIAVAYEYYSVALQWPFPYPRPLVVPTLLLTTTLAYHRQKRPRRKLLGLCLKCGYDLRGSNERCPECGLSLEKRKTKGESTCEQEC